MEPERLTEYFLTVGFSADSKVIRCDGGQDLSDVSFEAGLLDAYPKKEHSDLPVPQGLYLFCIPDGLRFHTIPMLPRFHSFSMTTSEGQKLYGYCLEFYEEASDSEIEMARKKALQFLAQTNKVESALALDTVAIDFESDASYSDPMTFEDATNLLQTDTTLSMDQQVSPNLSESTERTCDAALLVSKTLFVPKAIVMLSKWMFLNQFRTFLQELYRQSLTPNPIPLERFITNFMFEVPLPPQGSTTVQYRIANTTIELKRPPTNNPLSCHNFPFMDLFSCLSPNHVVTLVELLLQERSILFLSERSQLLNTACETIMSLLYPFQWKHVSIPLLPQSLFEFVFAPVPFLIGTKSHYITDLSLIPEHVTIVDLDSNVLLNTDTFPQELRLPYKQRSKLLAQLRSLDVWHRFTREEFLLQHAKLDLAFSYAPRPGDTNKSVLTLQNPPLTASETHGTFFRAFVSLLMEYRRYCIRPKDGKIQDDSPECLFECDEFLRQQPNKNRPFFTGLFATQAFSIFIDSVWDPSCVNDFLFFDESIQQKLNRSILRRSSATPFLDDTQFENHAVYACPGPDKSALPLQSSFCYSNRWPMLNARYMTRPRAVKTFVRQPASQQHHTAAATPSHEGTRTESFLSEVEALRFVFDLWFMALHAVTLRSHDAKNVLVALRVLKRLPFFGIKPRVDTCRSLIEICGACKSPSTAMKVMETMKVLNIVPDATIYSILVQIFYKNSDLQKTYHHHIMSTKTLKKRFDSISMQTDQSHSNTDKYAGFLDLDCCRKRFRKVLVGLELVIDEPCPKCDVVLTDREIRNGWSDSDVNFTTTCPKCNARFVPHFSIEYVNKSASKGHSVVVCEYLSPKALLAELQSILDNVDGAYLCSGGFHRNSPSLFWCLIWNFSNLGLPMAFLLPWLKGAPAAQEREGPRLSMTSFMTQAVRYRQTSIDHSSPKNNEPQLACFQRDCDTVQ